MADTQQKIEHGSASLGLWWSFWAGFVAWGLDLGISYVLEQHSCSTGHYYVLHVTSLVCFAMALSGIATGYKEFKLLPENTREEGGSHFERALFQAVMGMVFSASFAVVIIAGSVPRWILRPCE